MILEYPTKLYHATWPTNCESIEKEGLKANWEGVYLTNKPHYAAGFLNLRRVEIVGIKEIELNGKIEHLPDVVKHASVEVYEIDAYLLERDKLRPSTDHAADFYPDDLESWVYDGDIPSLALVRRISYPFDD